MNLRTITDAPDLRGQTVLLRASLNVPLVDGVVRNQFRLTHTLPTLRFLQDAGAKTIVVGHIGRATTDTLEPVHRALQTEHPIGWAGSLGTPECATALEQMAPGDSVLLENLRQDEREQANDPALAKELAALADVYVNDAFAVLHRAHASIVGVPEHLPAYAGLRVMEEVQSLAAAMEPAHPSLFILGGAKFETKFSLVEQYLDIYDELFIGGALAHDVLRARGYEIGQSLVSDISLADVPFINDPRLRVPEDVVVSRADGSVATLAIEDVTSTDTIFDAGPETTARLEATIASATTVLWNGPLGNYEAGFNAGTEAVATALADSVSKSYVGGGDTVAAIESIDRAADFTFISTGGGAMLSYLEHGSLPGLTPLLAA